MIENKLFKHLSTVNGVSTLISSRIYPVVLPQHPTYPCVTYSRVAGNRENDVSSGYCGLENVIIQVDAWAPTYDQVASLSSAVITAMCASTSFSCIAPNSPIDYYEDEIQIYRRTIDFSIWNRE
jgi:hypothetical protein